MEMEIDHESALLDGFDGGDRLALARITRLVVARLRALGAYELHGRWDDACTQVVTSLLEAGHVVPDLRSVGLQRWIDRAVWLRMAMFLRRRPLSGSPASASRDARSASLRELDERRPLRLAARQAFARIPRERQELLWRRYLDGDGLDELARCSSRSASELEHELMRAREEFRSLLGIAGALAALEPERGAGEVARADAHATERGGTTADTAGSLVGMREIDRGGSG